MTVSSTVLNLVHPLGTKDDQPLPRRVIARGKSLVDRRERARAAARAADEALYRFVDDASREHNVSVRQLARAIGVPASTLGGWKKSGQHLSE